MDNAESATTDPDAVDARSVIHNLNMTPEDVVIGGPASCFTVTGLKVFSTRDALTIFEACRQGVLPRVVRRLTDAEKQLICDGTVVVFDEKQAKMKRWTDGRIWTPSRILGNFLVYRELERKIPPNQEGVAELVRMAQTNCHSEFRSSNKGLFFCKPYGLMKRTISLAVPDDEDGFLAQVEWRPPRVHQQHLVAYFRAETAAMLPTPEDMEELQGLRLPLGILRIQRFRRPVKIEMFDNNNYDVYDTEDDDDNNNSEEQGPGRQTARIPHAPSPLLPPPPQQQLAKPVLLPASYPLVEQPVFDSLDTGDSLLSHPPAESSQQHQRTFMLLAPPAAYPQQPMYLESGNYQVGPPTAFQPSPLELQPPESIAVPSMLNLPQSPFAHPALPATVDPFEFHQLRALNAAAAPAAPGQPEPVPVPPMYSPLDGVLRPPVPVNQQPVQLVSPFSYPQPQPANDPDPTDVSEVASEI
ncbi:Global transcription regulator sge1 [Coemansia sp. RSA 2711]|nr:Global transcription regulator sge1 [Coemansia sp. RSA 2711]